MGLRPGSDQKLLRAMFALARGCHSPVEPALVLDGILDCLLDVMGAERGFILLAPALVPGRDAALEAEAGLVTSVSRRSDDAHEQAYSRTVVKWVLKHQRGLVVPDSREDTRFRAVQSVLAGAARSVLAAPLLRDGAPVGVIYLEARAARHAFHEADLALLEVAAEHALVAVSSAREREKLAQAGRRLGEVARQEASREFDVRALVGPSPAMGRLRDALALVAPQDTTVLITGPSGSGKELVARAVHDLSPRRERAFVAVNVAALSAGVPESELFGHEKGAFTGAAERRPGRFELADGGTLFLDEIGELDPAVQVKLLRVLQERTIERVGSTRPLPVDVRLVFATHADLPALVAQGRFRADLFYRINVFPLRVPPLSERREDVPELAAHFLRALGPRMGRKVAGIGPRALELLCACAWPHVEKRGVFSDPWRRF